MNLHSLPSFHLVTVSHCHSSHNLLRRFKKNLKMQNEDGQITELYIPRKCSATNRLITAKDHASVQINIGHLDESGVYNGHFSTFALCGYVRAQGDADSGLDRLWQKKKVELKQ
ncbi:small ribosomal subunit protein eS21y [Cicer arietinum]|uniref:40S ribosomal protein S21-2 n=1 Tax=Cicer arietinum TaxID=3827 RepID=A0A1S2XGW8_CICAR|nr:40S ribosomal protein S21-2 [Cicer arietinum]